MSSAILYLAIVAIWAGVLVPRWLRREPHREATSRSRQASSGQGGAAGGYASDAEDRGSPATGVSVGGSERSGDARGHPRSRTGHGARDGARVKPRGGVMAARRRLFGVLATLFAVAMAAAAAGLAGWWVVLPPAGMLGAYMMLLREAARADAERRARRVQRQRVAAPAGSGARLERDTRLERDAGAAASGAVAFEEVEETATARVIDLTAHVSDEPYDQDADAKLRAVGD